MARNLEQLRAASKLSPEQLAEVDANVTAEVARMHLADIREARRFTQQTVATNLGMAQGDLSRLEHRTDAYVSTLRSFIEAMGGTFRMIAEFPDGDPVEIAGNPVRIFFNGGDKSADDRFYDCMIAEADAIYAAHLATREK